jgi:hypothetical protein
MTRVLARRGFARRGFARRGIGLVAALILTALVAGPVAACGGLIGPNGAVNLLRTTTFAGYHDGIEHYVTAFQFAGGGGSFGSLTPLPGVPSSVEKGGDWTLQRLVRETEPFAFRDVRLLAGDAASAEAEVLLEVRIDALDVTVLRGGGEAVGRWATENGFRLPPDAPEVLDFYAARSPIFLAAVFDADAATELGQTVGDGTPVHITIPTDNPWVPLRILALGKTGDEPVEADVYLLTDRRPALMPVPTGRNGMAIQHNAPATDSLLDDLRSDRGMEWIPSDAWLTRIRIDGTAKQLSYDLAIDASGARAPSAVAAGLVTPAQAADLAGRALTTDAIVRLIAALTFSVAGIGAIVGLLRRRSPIGLA